MVVPVEPRTIASLLAKVQPFDELDNDTHLAMARGASRRVVERGQVIFWQDDPGESMFVLLEGAVKLMASSRDGELMEFARHLPPASFGELAVIDGGPREVTAETVERSTLLVLTRADLLQLLRSDYRVAEAMLRSLATIVRRTTRQVTDLAFLSLPERLAVKLLDLAEPNHARTRHVSQAELSTMVGATRQTVNQALRSLESRGYIRSAGRSFEILDREQLRRLAKK
jgi:CRP/FNR family cyclic AMP-dependent transcriptional regulator